MSEDGTPVGISVSINSDDIEKYIVAKVLESKLGAAIESAINKEIASLNPSSYNSPLQTIVHNLVVRSVEEVLDQPEQRERIRAAVREYITDERVDSIIQSSWAALQEKIKRDRY